MDGLTLTTCSINRFLLHSSSRRRNHSRKPGFLVFASNEEPKFDRWDEMELKFGRMLGEDPKLTLAKIMGKKSNPEVSYLDIEKSFGKKKGELINDDIVDVPFDGAEEGPVSNSLNELNLVRPVPKKGIKFEANDKPIDGSEEGRVSNSMNGLNLVRPVSRKGIKFEANEKPIDGSEERRVSNSMNGLNLVRPVPKKGIKFEANDKAIGLEPKKPSQSVGKAKDSTKGSIPNVLLRKPSTFNDDEIETKKSLKLEIKPNLLLKMRKEQPRESFTDITLLKKPKPVSPTSSSSGVYIGSSSGKVNERSSVSSGGLETSGEAKASNFKSISPSMGIVDASKKDIGGETSKGLVSKLSDLEDELKIGLQPLEQSDSVSAEKEAAITQISNTNSSDSGNSSSMQTALQGKPQRLDQSIKERPHPIKVETVRVSAESYSDAAEIENFLATSPLQEHEDTDWARAEDLLKTGGREEVELISCSTRGFVVSFGSMIGFLPYRNLGAKWKFLAFESWLRKKGLDPSTCKQNLGIVGSYEVQNKNPSLGLNQDSTMDREIEGKLSPDMKLEDLLKIYDQEKIKFLSSFVGQRIKVNVVMADRNSRRLMFSGRPKEKEELVAKKRSLMAKLSVGDVVKCCIKKITYFGIFVEVEGVPALIHQSEVSWDATLDPSSFFKIGQIVEAKVHLLDFALERITLSLKEITPDPLIEALEYVIGDSNSLDVRLEATQTDVEWADVESLINEMQQIEGIQSVSKGRFFLSPGLAPTFQVYMASMFENQYKLLARSENKVQEVIVQASLDKEEMKAVILTCTNRVE